MSKLYWSTVNDVLKESLLFLMDSTEFSAFRLVGGTSLSLQLGHRLSVDIDLFTDAAYGTVDFNVLDAFLLKSYAYVESSFGILPGIGRSYVLGHNKDNLIKLDIYYTDKFIQEPLVMDGLRMATPEEIIAMKMDVVSREGRKKDFWDLHELLENYSISQMLTLHEKRYPYTHEKELLVKNLTNFTKADKDFEPICLKGKHWELIKLDFLDAIEAYLK